jgi:hypothetical protein
MKESTQTCSSHRVTADHPVKIPATTWNHVKMNNILRFCLILMTTLVIPAAFLHAQTYDGYTLYYPQNGTKAYLVDMSGSTYHTWTFSSSSTTCYTSYLLANGYLIRTVNHSGNSFTGGPISGEVQKVDYSGNIVWDYVYSTSSYCSHHDICPMPNGNVLLICYERKTAAEAVAMGCSQSIEMWPDKIVEIQPSGTSGGTVIWEWHVWDHMCQHYDATKPNYYVIAEHPELLNINYNTTTDWMHTNGIDYNATLDQITFSAHNMNEVYVIDHSTTTAQAATHTGGNSGKGGDFLYRWGNPAAYNMTGTTDFNVVHDAHWVPYTNPTYPNALCGFNNKGGSSNKSCVDIFVPPYSGYTYTWTPGTAYTPSTYNWRHTYSGTATQDMGSSQQLPNGNTLVCIAQSGFIYEINPSQTQVWSKTVGGTLPQAARYPPCFVTGTYTATASATPSTICSGSSSQLNVTVTGGVAYTYSWTSSPSGFTSTIQNPVVSPIVTTVYTVTITNGPCSATGTVTVTVNNPPTVSVSATPSTICNGSSSQLSCTASGGTTYTYSWTSNPSGFTSTLQNPVVSPTVTTIYTCAVTSNGCTGSNSTTVTVNARPTVVTAATPGTICAGASSQLTATPSGGTTYTYLWTSNPTGFTSTLQNPIVTPTVTTVYTCTVTSNGCTGTSSSTVSVNANPTVTATATPSQICSGASSQLNSYPSGGTTYTYSWTSIPAGFTSDLQNPVVSPTVYTTYIVTVTSNGCQGSNYTVVRVNTPPTVNATSDPSSVCPGSSSQLYADVSGGSSYTFSWTSNPAGFTSDIQNPVVTPLVNTTYMVAVTSNECSSSSSASVTVKTKPTVTATATPSEIMAGDSSQLNAIASGGTSYSYIWSSNPAGYASTLQNPVVYPTATITYTVSVSSNGCEDTSSVKVTVNQGRILNLSLFLEGFFDPGSGTMRKVQDADIYGDSWDKFPGTTVDTFSVYLADPESYEYLFSKHGVLLSTDGTATMTWTVSGGNYYIVIRHRSSVETWSGLPVSFSSSPVSYNFKYPGTQAYGSNLKEVSPEAGVYELFGGDFTGMGSDQDGYVDIFDNAMVFNNAQNGTAGYFPVDVTGDGFVDIFDMILVFNNLQNSVGMNTPANPAKKRWGDVLQRLR